MFPIIEELRWTLWTGFIIMINTNSDRLQLNKILKPSNSS